MNAQPFHVFVAGLAFLCTAVDGRVGGEEVSVHVSGWSKVVHTRYCLHGVQTYDSQLPRDDLDLEPSSLLELMSLLFWNEFPPNVQVPHRPAIGAAREDVMRHYVVVAESRHDRYDKVMGAVAMATVSKDVGKPRDHVLILLYDLLLRPRYVLVIVVSRRVARPYDKVDVVLDIVLDPLERLVNERIRRVAASRLCAVESSGPASAVAC